MASDTKQMSFRIAAPTADDGKKDASRGSSGTAASPSTILTVNQVG